jgi:hypothetical protein
MAFLGVGIAHKMAIRIGIENTSWRHCKPDLWASAEILIGSQDKVKKPTG